MDKGLLTYSFLLRFFTHYKGALESNSVEFEFEIATGYKLSLTCFDAGTISDGREFYLTAGGFPTEQMAYEAGQRLLDILLISGARLRVGFDTGIFEPHRSNIRLSSAARETAFKASGVKLVDKVLGLSVHDEEFPVSPFRLPPLSMKVSGSGASMERFSSVLSALIALAPCLTDKDRVTLELYGASHFEHTSRAKFLILMVGLESLLEKIPHCGCAKGLVSNFIEQTKASSLDVSEKEQITSGLRWLRDCSITETLRRMANDHLEGRDYGGKSADKFIAYCYSLRGQLMHSGNTEKTIDFKSLSDELSEYFSDLLCSKFRMSDI